MLLFVHGQVKQASREAAAQRHAVSVTSESAQGGLQDVLGLSSDQVRVLLVEFQFKQPVVF